MRRAPPSGAASNSVLATQVAFMASAYGDAFLSGDLDASKAHISAVLDHWRRSFVCVLIGFVALAALINLEAKRCTARRATRLALAWTSGVSIVAVAAIRESHYFPAHAFFSCAAFGAAVLLAWLLAEDAASVRRAALLSAVCAATGGLQFAYLAGLVDKAQFPSWALGAGEFALVVLFGHTISVA